MNKQLDKEVKSLSSLSDLDLDRLRREISVTSKLLPYVIHEAQLREIKEDSQCLNT